MKTRNYMKGLAAGILSAAILGGSALAANVTATSNVNMRTGPGTSYSIICTIPKNQSAEIVDTSGNWYKVSYNGKTGYVSKSYVKDTAAGTTGTTAITGSTVYTTGNLNVRSTSSTSGKILGTLKKGTEITVTGQKNGWYQISYNGKTGYISAKYTTATKPSGTTTTPDTTAATGVRYTTANLNVRSTAAASGKLLGTLKKGAEITVTGQKNGWYQISYNGQTAYVSGKYTTATKPSGSTSTAGTVTATSKTVYTTSNLNVRSKAAKTGSILGTLKKGAEITVTGESNGWYQLSYNGKTGYVSAKYTTATKPAAAAAKTPETPSAATTKVVYTTTELNVRATASKTGTVIGVLKKGEEVTVTGQKNGWYEISYNGKTGYIGPKYTTTTKP